MAIIRVKDKQLQRSCENFEGFCVKWRDFIIQTAHSFWILKWGARFFRQLSIWAQILRRCYHSTLRFNAVWLRLSWGYLAAFLRLRLSCLMTTTLWWPHCDYLAAFFLLNLQWLPYNDHLVATALRLSCNYLLTILQLTSYCNDQIVTILRLFCD